MSIEINLSVLVEYTDWQREKWHALLREHGERALKISIGPHGDGRFQTVGEKVDLQDFLVCPALSGEVRTGQANA
jgi:hypothetical protein